MGYSNNLAKLESAIGFVFEEKPIGLETLNADQHPIYHNGEYVVLRRNDDLAMPGDNVIDTILLIMWDRSRDSGDRRLVKGDWTRLQQDLVSEESLANRGFSHGLDAYVIKNPGHSGRISKRMMATAVESIIGGVFKDSGYDLKAVRAVMEKLGFFEHPMLANTDCSFIADH